MYLLYGFCNVLIYQFLFAAKQGIESASQFAKYWIFVSHLDHMDMFPEVKIMPENINEKFLRGLPKYIADLRHVETLPSRKDPNIPYPDMILDVLYKYDGIVAPKYARLKLPNRQIMFLRALHRLNHTLTQEIDTACKNNMSNHATPTLE